MATDIKKIDADRRRALWRSRKLLAVSVLTLIAVLIGIAKAAVRSQFGYELVDVSHKVPIVPAWPIRAVPPYSYPWGVFDIVIWTAMAVIMFVTARRSKKAAIEAEELAGYLAEAKAQERRRGYGLS